MGLEAFENSRIALPAELSSFSLAANMGLFFIQGIPLGVGVDACDIPRIQEAVEKHPLYVPQVYTSEEIEYCDLVSGPLRFERYAARFAAKEAVAKAIGGVPHSFLDVCIINEEGGKPKVELRGRAKEHADQLAMSTVLLSLSHLRVREVAIAFSIAVGRGFENGR